MHPFQCPKCNSKNVRDSVSRSFWESIRTVAGVFPARCRDCDTRWSQPLWDLGNCLYARCPHCYGLELSSWTPSHYRVPTLSKVWLTIGAKPRRCEFCRRNFVSFRPCKIQFVRRKLNA